MTPSTRAALSSVLTSRTLWLALLTAGLPPLLRACRVAPAVLTDELLGILAGLGVAIAAARLTTTAPVTRRGRPAPLAPPPGADPPPAAPGPDGAASAAAPMFPPEAPR